MRVLYQPTESSPQDWRETTDTAWASVVATNVHAICVQGVTFEGADRYSVQKVGPSKCRVFAVHDDPADWPAGTRWARVVDFHNLQPDPNPDMGGAINTLQTQTIYTEPGIAPSFSVYAGNPKITVLPWSDFDPRPMPAPRSGLWVTDAAHEAHQAIRSVHGWREWTEGLDPRELDSNGRLAQQRYQGRFVKPKGTRTYYHNDTNRATGVHTSTHENALATSPSGAATENSGNVGNASDPIWTATTASGEPNSAAWPTTGVYRYQIDCTAAGADLAFGLLNIGGTVGHFARVNDALTADSQSFQQAQAAFTGSGLHLATITNPAWSVGLASDRFEIHIVAQRVTGHGNQTLDLQLGETDDFADGPWAAAATPRRFLIT